MTTTTEQRHYVLPERMEVPLDEEDWRFTKSFGVDEAGSPAARSFFDQYGFIVFRDVATPHECRACRADMWEMLEETSDGFTRADHSTWGKANLSRFGMCGRAPVFRSAMLRVRQSPNLHRVFSSILNDNDIVCSHDRWLLYRKTTRVRAVPGRPEQEIDMPHWRTMKNIHLDMNPWEYAANDRGVYDRLGSLRYASTKDFIRELNDVAASMGQLVQGILNLRHNYDEAGDCGGGTILVPGFHKVFDRWVNDTSGAGALLSQQPPSGGAMQYAIDADNPLQKLAVRVTMREGSLLVWDRRCAHGSAPNTSHRTRFGVPVCCFSRRLMGPERARARAAAVWAGIVAGGFEAQVTPVGRTMFGLNDLPSPPLSTAEP